MIKRALGRWTIALLTVVALLLGYLAYLQWRWLLDIENYHHVSTYRTVRSSSLYWKLAFEQEIEGLAGCFDAPGGSRAELASQLGPRFSTWRQESRWPDLLEAVYLISTDPEARPVLERYEPASGAFVSAAWSADLEPLRSEATASLAAADRELTPRRGATLRLATSVPAVILPTLLQPEAGSGQSEVAWLAVQIDASYLRSEFFPALTELFFSPPNFLDPDLALIETETGRLVYSTLPIESLDEFGRSDAAYGLVDTGSDGDEMARVGIGQYRTRGNEAYPNANRRPTEADHTWFRNLWAQAFYSGHWQLYVRRSGDAPFHEVQAARQQAYRTSFAILAFVAAAMVGIFALARRAQRLARQQMEFVAGVSHELRTPLAVLSAAGDNLSDSLVNSDEQLEQYGRVIQDETRRLQGMVENVLHMARRGSVKPTLQPLEVGPLIEESLRLSKAEIEKAGFELEASIEPGAIRVMGNARSLQSALLNLISNALKYGAERKWLHLSLETADGGAGPEARITVRDRGRGIEPDEVEHIYEPFFRGSEVRSEQIEGSGLGLALVRDVARVHRGRITVDSEIGQGSTFTLHLPLLEGA